MDNFDNVLVIDADGHVYEGNVDLASRMPEKWRSQAPVRLKDNEGNSRILLEGRLWSASQGLGPGVSGPMTDKARGFRAGMVDPHARLKDMDEEGIDVAILFDGPPAGTLGPATDRGDGTYEASRSRTLAVPVARVYRAFTDPRLRKRWLSGVKLTIRKATPHKSVRISWEDGTAVEVGFLPKGAARSAVAVTHRRLSDKADCARRKEFWGERLDALAGLLTPG